MQEKKGARHSSPTRSRSKRQTRQNVVLILVASLLIVSALFYAWGQTIQAEHAETVHKSQVMGHE